MDVLKLNSDKVFCVGDIHGNFDGIIGWIKRYGITDSTIIFCGDIGMGFYKPEYYKQTLGKINKEFKKRNSYCLFLRGNHDDDTYFNGNLYKKGNCLTLRDYTIVEVYNKDDESQILPPHKTILCVGGAISIDRTYRINSNDVKARDYMRWHGGVSYEEALMKIPQCYWINEMPIYDEEKLKEITDSGIKINYVCTHTSPSFCEPHTKEGLEEWSELDEALFEDIDNERKTMDKLYQYLIDNDHPLKTWFYAHYHYHSSQEYDGIKFYLLDMDRYGNFDMVEMI